MKKNAVVSGIRLTSVIAWCLMVLPAARADASNQATKLTFSHTVQISGRVLPAGTYWFILSNINSPNIVQVFNSDRSRLYATIFSVNAVRLKHNRVTPANYLSRERVGPRAASGNPVLVLSG